MGKVLKRETFSNNTEYQDMLREGRRKGSLDLQCLVNLEQDRIAAKKNTRELKKEHCEIQQQVSHTSHVVYLSLSCEQSELQKWSLFIIIIICLLYRRREWMFQQVV